MNVRLVHREGYSVDDPSEPELMAAIDALEDSRDALTVYRSSIRWLRVEKDPLHRFYFYNYSLWSVGQAIQPVSQRVAKQLLLAYASRKRGWSGSIRFANPKGKGAVAPDAEDGSPEMWREVAVVALEQELAHTPERLSMLAMFAVFGVFLLWSGSGLSLAVAVSVAALVLAAGVIYAAWAFSRAGQEFERLTRNKAS